MLKEKLETLFNAHKVTFKFSGDLYKVTGESDSLQEVARALENDLGYICDNGNMLLFLNGKQMKALLVTFFADNPDNKGFLALMV